jgi:integrase
MQETLTAQFVERIKPPAGGRLDVFDQKLPGLVLTVSAKGTKTWYLMFRLAGDSKRQRKHLGRYPAMLLADARDRAREDLLAASRGIDPRGPEPGAPPALLTFGRLAEAYIEKYARRHKATWETDRDRLARYWLPRWANRPAADITKRDVLDVREIIAKNGMVEANRNMALIQRMYNWAAEQALLEANPAQRIPPFPEQARQRVLTEQEIRVFWTATFKLSPEMGAIYRLKLITGQRSCEVESMRWQDMDGSWWTIPAHLTKEKDRPHRVFLTGLAREELDRLTVTGTWVFPSDSKAGHIDNVGTALKRLRRLTGIADFNGHDLRRTVHTLMGKIKIRKFDRALVLNHVRPADGATRADDVYDIHDYDDEKQAALDKWAVYLTALGLE